MKNKIINEKTFTAIIIVSIIGFPLLELIGDFFNIKYFLQEDFLSFIGIFGCILAIIGLILKIKNKNKNKTDKFVLSDLFIILSIIFCIISIVFSQSITSSLTGMRGYSETPLQVLGYFTLFIICTTISNEKNRKSILYAFLALGIFEAVVAFLQNFSIWPVTSPLDPSWHTKDHLAFGFTQHCNFFAPIAVIFSGLFATKFVHSKNIKEHIICLFGAVICCLSAFFTYTRLAWVGIFAVLFGLLILEFSNYIAKKDKQQLFSHIKKYIIILVCFITCFFVVGNISGQIQKDVAQSQKELNSVKTENKVESFGSSRGMIWKAGLSALKKHPFTGVGFDIYSYSFFIANDVPINMQNKGHNEYIHTLVTQGIFSGINYLLFAFYCCYFPFKKILENKTDFGKSVLTKVFLVALFAYFVQALFNSSVTNVAVYKWILMGLLLPRVEQKDLRPVWEKLKILSKKEIKFKNK